MPKRFPKTSCQPDTWNGDSAIEARTAASSDSDHGFQDLVTSILCAELPAQVKRPRKGIDGKIDVWIEAGKESALFRGPYPAIVECKYHGNGDWDQLRDRWGEVRRGLQTAAGRDWTGLEAPWLTTRSYIYCVSADLTIDTIQRLRQKIREDLAALPRDATSTFADLEVQVLTWNDLREHANRFPSVCDAWLGPADGTILPRAAYITQFRDDDFRRWLRNDLLPFVEPSAGAEYHPERIARLLAERVSNGGVILHGPGGAGKTRTAVQVGAIVEAAPYHWRVLHVNAGEDGVSAEALIREIAPAADEPTLVVYDYLDQAADFSPDAFVRNLQADYPGTRVVLLGTARHAQVRRARKFIRVTMVPDERHVDGVLAAIRSVFEKQLGPGFGAGLLASVVGRRPVIALLIYEELCRRLGDGSNDLTHLREAQNLSAWLEGRLHDATKLDGGSTESEHDRLARRIAAASVFAGAPQTERELAGVAANVLQRMCGQPFAVHAEAIVKKLTELGWLVRSGDELLAAHDVITDELLESVLVAYDGTLFADRLEAALAPAVASSRTLGRMALSFGRLIGDQLRNRDAEAPLRRAVSRWFKEHAAGVKALLESASDDAGRDSAAYAVGAVLASPAWSAPLLSQWEGVVGPWLEAQKNVPQIRHLLYRALHSADTTHALERSLLQQAVDWLAVNSRERHASFLAEQVLEKLDVPALEPIVPKLAGWLRLHGAVEQARYVVMAVLRRPELPESLQQFARDAAERWLANESNRLAPAAPALFRLFAKSRPSSEQLERTRQTLIEMHLDHARKTDCRAVDSLRFLVELDAKSGIEPAMKALERPIDPRNAARLLASLLRGGDLGNARADVVRRAIDLDTGALLPSDAAPLYEALLAAAGEAAIDAACGWVERHPLAADAGPVLAALLRLPLGDHERKIVHVAHRWLPLNIRTVDAGAVIPPLLRSPILQERGRPVVSHALEWIRRHPRRAEAQYAIEEIAKRDVPAPLQKRFARMAVDRFLELGHGPGMSYAGQWAIDHSQLLPHWQCARLMDAAADWVETHADDTQREYVANALLKNIETPHDVWRRAATVVMEILRRESNPKPWYSITALSKRPLSLTDEELAYLRALIARLGLNIKPRVRECIGQAMPLERVAEVLSGPAAATPDLVNTTMRQIERLAEDDLLRRHFLSFPAYAFLLAWRVEDPQVARKIVAFIRNSLISSLKLGRQLESFRLHLLAAAESMSETARPDPNEVLVRAGLDDNRLVLRAALDEVQREAVLPPALFAAAVSAIESDFAAGCHVDAGRLISRLIVPAERSGEAAMIETVTRFCAEACTRADPHEREIFRGRCRKIIDETPSGSHELLVRFGIVPPLSIDEKLTRSVASGDPVPPLLIDEASREVSRRGRSITALPLVEALLVIAVREDDAKLFRELLDTRSGVLAAISRQEREAFRVRVYEAIEAPWEEYVRRRKLLESFGLRESLQSLLNVTDGHLLSGDVPEDLPAYMESVVQALVWRNRFDSYITMALQRLLALSAHRGGGSASTGVLELASFILGRVTEKIRTDCARLAYQALGAGAWPDVRKGEADLRSLGLETDEHRLPERYLKEMLFHGRALEADGLQQSAALAAARLDEGNVGGAGYLLVPLLPLAAHLGDRAFEAEVHAISERFLVLASKFDRDGFRKESLGEEIMNAWPSRDQAEVTLQKLGIALPRISRLVSEGASIDVHEISAAIDGCTAMIENGASEDAALPLASTLAAAFRCDDDTIRYRARRLLGRFLDEPMTGHEELHAFTKECERLLDEGAWGDRPSALQTVEELGIAPVRLQALATDERLPVAREVITSAVRTVDTILEGPWHRRAEDYLLCLVPLSARAGGGDLTASVDQAVERMVAKTPTFKRRIERLKSWAHERPPILNPQFSILNPYDARRMVLVVYAATAVLALWLIHRHVRALSRGAAIFLFLVPFALAGKALLLNEAFGPIDAAYMGEPLNAIRMVRGVDPPHNLVATDIYTQMIPWRQMVRESLRHGQWPLWNPSILCGDILAAAGQPAAYHPFTLIACLMAAPLSFTFTVAMVFLVAAAGAFAFARELGCRESAAALAAAGWTYCSSLALYVLWPHGAWAYLPLVLLATRRVVHEPGVRSGAFLMTALTLLILAGHPETVLHLVTIGVAYALFELKRAAAPAERAIAVAFVAGALAVLLCAIYLLPFLEAVPQTAEYPWRKILRDVEHYETPLEVGVSVLTNFFPFLHIRRWIEPGPAGLKAETAAVGSVILALATYGIWRVRTRTSWFFTALAVICLLIHSAWKPVAQLLRHVPLYDISLNVRFAFGAAFAFALLAALGVEELVRRDDRRGAAITLAAVLVVLTAGQLWIKRSFVIDDYGNWGSFREFAELFFLGIAALLLAVRVPLRAVAPALVLLVAAQRMVSEGGVHKSFPMSIAYPPMEVMEPMKAVHEPFRVVGQGLALIPGMSAFYGLEDPRGYEAMTFNPLFETYPLWSVHQPFFFNRVDDITKPFVSMMNVRFAIAGVWLPVPYGWRLAAQQRHVILLENMNAFDRAFIPRNVKLGMTDKDALDEMKVTGDFHERAWITSDAPLERANGPGAVSVRAKGMSEYDLDADMQGDGWIVLTESAWKGWRAYVDGHRVKPQRANVAFLSVYVPKGRHAVRFVYLPESFVAGRAVSFATLFGLVIISAYLRRSRFRGVSTSGSDGRSSRISASQ